ncbi:tape measure protein [Bacillus cereus]|nr:tape measure protein [Bacillus cereus]
MRESFTQSSRASSQQIMQNFQRAGQGIQQPLVSSANVVNRSFASIGSTSTSVVGKILSGYSTIVRKTQSAASTIKSSFSSGFTAVQNAGVNSMNRIQRSMRDVEKTNDSVVKSIVKGATILTGITSTIDLLGRAIKRVDIIDTATKSLEVLTGSSEKAKLVINDVIDAIEGTPIALNDVALGAKKMVAAGMEAEKIKPVFTAIADAAYGVGDGAESIDQITDAFASMQSAGTVYADDINRLVDAGIPAWQMLANQTGKSVAEIKDYASKGSLESKEAIDMLVKGIEEGTDGIAGHTAAMAGLAKTAGDTISGSWGNMKTSIVKIVANIADVLKGDIIDALKGLTNAFKAVGAVTASEGFKNGLLSFVNILKVMISVVGKTIAILKPFAPLLLGIVSAFMTFKAIVGVTTLVTQGIVGLTIAFNAMKLAMLTNPFTAIIAGAVGLGVALVTLYKTNESFRNAVTSAWEAISNVFSGSIEKIKSVGSAFQELFTSGDPTQLIEKFAGFIPTIIGFLVGGIPQLILTGMSLLTSISDGMGLSIPELIQKIIDIVIGIINTFVAELPKFLTIGIEILMALIDGLIQALPQIIDVIIKIVLTLVDTIIQNLPKIIDAGMKILMALIDGIIKILPKLIETAIKLIMKIAETLIQNLPKIIESGVKILKALIDGIMKILPQLIETAIKLIMKIVETLIQNLPKIIEAGIKILKALIEGIIKILPELIATGLKLILTLVGELIKNLPKILEAGVKLIAELIKGIISMAKNLGSTITKDIIPQIVNTLKKVDLLQVGKSIIGSLIKGIGSMASSVVKTVGDIAGSIWDGFTGLFSGGPSSGNGGGKGRSGRALIATPSNGADEDVNTSTALGLKRGAISLNKATSKHLNIPKYSLDSMISTSGKGTSKSLRTSQITKQIISSKDNRKINLDLYMNNYLDGRELSGGMHMYVTEDQKRVEERKKLFKSRG